MKLNLIPTIIIRVVLILVFLPFFSGCRDNQSELTWTSLNMNIPTVQGDAHLLSINSTDFILIDTGPRETTDRLINYLKNKNCCRIQAVIITHGHQDHYGGLVPLLNSGITIDRVYFNPPAHSLVTNEWWGCSPAEITEIEAELQKKNIPLCGIAAGTEWFLGKDVSLRAICAFNGLDTPIGRTDINDTSAIIMLKHGKLKMLFAADLNRPLGDYLISHSSPKLLRADLLKFPHHGAEAFANDSFFCAVSPRAVIITAPKELWLSPRSERARRLTKGCQVYVNGIEGNITVVSDGNSFRIYSDKSPPVVLQH